MITKVVRVCQSPKGQIYVPNAEDDTSDTKVAFFDCSRWLCPLLEEKGRQANVFDNRQRRAIKKSKFEKKVSHYLLAFENPKSQLIN